jgi:hypothetical protein
LLAVEIGVFVLFIAGNARPDRAALRACQHRFRQLLCGGTLGRSGTPELAYDQGAHYAAEQRNHGRYRVSILLLSADIPAAVRRLARLPYLPAFLLFEAATLVFYLIVARRILGERGWPVFIPLLAFPGVFWTMGLGQNAFLTAALFGAATLWVDRRPVLAGVLFGALCYKPHFGLLVPVALLAGRHWRASAAAFTSAAVLCGLSLILFGWQTWHDFLAAAAGSHATYESGQITFGGLVSPFGAVLLLGGTRAAAYAVQTGATLAAGFLVAVVWRRGYSLPVRAATLAAATLVAIPVVLIYDLMLGTIAAAWLLRDARRLPAWGTTALAGLFVLTLDPRGMAEASHIPIAPLVAIGLVALAAAQVFYADARSARYATP